LQSCSVALCNEQSNAVVGIGQFVFYVQQVRLS